VSNRPSVVASGGRPSVAWGSGPHAHPTTPLELEEDPDLLGLQDAGDKALRLLRAATKLGASDIHLRVDSPPFIRIEGELRALGYPALSHEFVQAAVEALAFSAGLTPEKLTRHQVDFTCVLSSTGRFRAHLYHQNGGPALVLRRVQDPIPDFAALRLPPIIKRIAQTNQGLVLVVGANGNGKSSTAASMLEYINQSNRCHVVTIEDPVEFVFKNQVSSFSQREVGRDVESYERGLEGALREDPDVVFVGELRSYEALELSLNAAESGRLVISTCHAQDSQRTIARLLNLVPVDFRDSVRSRLADALSGIVGQRLVQRKGVRSRILCTEIMINHPIARDCIRDPARLRGLTAALEAGAHEFGTHSFDQTLVQMVRDGLVALETAQAVATSPSELMRVLKGVR
jgi:twitching motility protein PilT